jgi:hypothetical protein
MYSPQYKENGLVGFKVSKKSNKTYTALEEGLIIAGKLL